MKSLYNCFLALYKGLYDSEFKCFVLKLHMFEGRINCGSFACVSAQVNIKILLFISTGYVCDGDQDMDLDSIVWCMKIYMEANWENISNLDLISDKTTR